MPLPIKSKVRPDYDEHQNLEELPLEQADRRQIRDMKFCRLKVKNLKIYSDDLIQKLVNKPISLELTLPLPDVYQKVLSDQRVLISNYEIISESEYAFNSVSLYNFKVDETTLAPFINSSIKAIIPNYDVEGTMEINKLLMCQDFILKGEIKLMRKVTIVNHIKVEGKKKP